MSSAAATLSRPPARSTCRFCCSKADATTRSPRTTTFLTAVEVYQARDHDQRRLLNHALFRRLCIADSRITDHEPLASNTLT